MELKSLQFNEVRWDAFPLSEYALLVSPKKCANPLAEIHKAMMALDAVNDDRVSEIIPAFDSITFLFKNWDDASLKCLNEIFTNAASLHTEVLAPKKHVVKVCYELGLDWEDVEKHTGLNKDYIIKQHTTQEYTIAMMGFLPGFVFLDGLAQELHCPRKESPRVCLPAGSVGIGGSQTGLYSLQSPGGWQIIGRSPQRFFEANEQPPTLLNAGDKLTFQSITESEFQSLNTHG